MQGCNYTAPLSNQRQRGGCVYLVIAFAVLQ